MFEITFNEQDHKYIVNNKEVRSVTQIMQDVGFSSPIPDFIHIQEAAEHGKEIHNMIEGYISNPFLDIKESKNPYLQTFVKFLNNYEYDVTASEYRIFSEKYDACGTIDVMAKANDNLIIIDIKVTSTTSKKHLVQVAMYARMMETDHACIFNLKTNEVKHAGVEHFELADKIFQAHLEGKQLYDQDIDTSYISLLIQKLKEKETIEHEINELKLIIQSDLGSNSYKDDDISISYIPAKMTEKINNKKLLKLAEEHISTDLLKTVIEEKEAKEQYRFSIKRGD